jgi:hypothetical protein
MVNRNGAKGSSFERQTADYWRDNHSEFVDRRVKTGAKDKGDLANVRVAGHRLVVECKSHARITLSQWIAEAAQEAINDEALMGVVVVKRKGYGQPKDQYVVMTQENLLKLLALADRNTSS